MTDGCARGWHRLGREQYSLWFRYGTRLRDAHGTFVYRAGPEPDDAACSSIWCYGDHGRPWTCVECRQQIDGPPTAPAPTPPAH